MHHAVCLLFFRQHFHFRTANLFTTRISSFHPILQSTTTTTATSASNATSTRTRINIHLPFKSLFYPPLNRTSSLLEREIPLLVGVRGSRRAMVLAMLPASCFILVARRRRFKSTPSCIKRQGHTENPETSSRDHTCLLDWVMWCNVGCDVVWCFTGAGFWCVDFLCTIVYVTPHTSFRSSSSFTSNILPAH